MSDVVAIHGIFMNWRSRAEMLRVWRDAMARGLQNVRYPGAENVVLECAFYGHLYNDGKAGAGTPYQLPDLEPGLEQELFLAIGDAAGKDDQGKDPEDDGPAAKVWLPDPFQRAIRRIERHGIFDGVSATAIRLVKQVGRYFRDQDFARQVGDELGVALETNPRVLVAHSLGSVIAYDWLRRQPTAPAPRSSPSALRWASAASAGPWTRSRARLFPAGQGFRHGSTSPPPRTPSPR